MNGATPGILHSSGTVLGLADAMPASVHSVTNTGIGVPELVIKRRLSASNAG
jgi:hypothetical protein